MALSQKPLGATWRRVGPECAEDSAFLTASSDDTAAWHERRQRRRRSNPKGGGLDAGRRAMYHHERWRHRARPADGTPSEGEDEQTPRQAMRWARSETDEQAGTTTRRHSTRREARGQDPSPLRHQPAARPNPSHVVTGSTIRNSGHERQSRCIHAFLHPGDPAGQRGRFRW